MVSSSCKPCPSPNSPPVLCSFHSDPSRADLHLARRAGRPSPHLPYSSLHPPVAALARPAVETGVDDGLGHLSKKRISHNSGGWMPEIKASVALVFSRPLSLAETAVFSLSFHTAFPSSPGFSVHGTAQNEYWSGLRSLFQSIFLTVQGIEPTSLALAAGFFLPSPWKPQGARTRCKLRSSALTLESHCPWKWCPVGWRKKVLKQKPGWDWGAGVSSLL